MMKTIEEGTHLQSKIERMVVDSDILAWRDVRTDGHTDGRTDTASYRDAMDASKKHTLREARHCSFLSLFVNRQTITGSRLKSTDLLLPLALEFASNGFC